MTPDRFHGVLAKQVKGNVRHVVAAVRSGDGSIDLAGAAGMADDLGHPMSIATPYLLASISKMYTAAFVLRLVDDGRLDMSDTLGHHLDDMVYRQIHVIDGVDRSADITVEELLSHTSGLADYYDDAPPGTPSLADELKEGLDQPVDLERVMAIVRSLPPAFPPSDRHGTRAHYCDTNFRLLAAIVESVTGEEFETGLQRAVLDPLGLEETYPHAAVAVQGRTEPAAVYADDSLLRVPQFLASHTPDGGLVATVGDSLRFLQAFFGGELFDRPMLDQQWNRIFSPFRYGMGIMRLKLPRVMSPFRPLPELLGHAGSTGSFAFYAPERDLFVAGTVDQVAAPQKGIRLMLRLVGAVS